MSRLSDLQAKIHSLAEIESILGAMKNLAIIEMNKVSKLMIAQTKVSATVDCALADFEFFFKDTLAQRASNGKMLCLLIGSERGFCGPFNERVIEKFNQATQSNRNVKMVVIGRKLAMKLGEDTRIEARLDGPNSADEISAVIQELAEKLLPYADFRWMFVQNDGLTKNDEITFPLENRIQPGAKPFAHAPLLNMPPQELYPQLLEQHLFSIMHRALYISFMAENRERLHHMEGALNQIEKDRAQLSLKLNGQRQEEITEELEILMLSSSNDLIQENT